MTEEEKILQAWEKLFENISASEKEEDKKYIDSLSPVGVSYEEYLDILNTVTSYNLSEVGLCDDIAFADFFNSSIEAVQMGADAPRVVDTSILVHQRDNSCESFDSTVQAGESNYAMAA